MRNKFILVGAVVMLAGCVSLSFDPKEYDGFVTMKILADEAVKDCGTPKVVDKVNSLQDLITHQTVYSRYRSSRQQITSATTEVYTMIGDLKIRYTDGEMKPSTTYCQEKLKNISQGITNILKTIGTMS